MIDAINELKIISNFYRNNVNDIIKKLGERKSYISLISFVEIPRIIYKQPILYNKTTFVLSYRKVMMLAFRQTFLEPLLNIESIPKQIFIIKKMRHFNNNYNLHLKESSFWLRRKLRETTEFTRKFNQTKHFLLNEGKIWEIPHYKTFKKGFFIDDFEVEISQALRSEEIRGAYEYPSEEELSNA